MIAEWGLDAFRYYVVRELAIGPDGNWTDEGFRARYNAELANGLGNLVNRSVSMLRKYRGGVVPPVSMELAAETAVFVRDTTAALDRHELQDALVSLWGLVTRANQYVDQTRPFSLARIRSRRRVWTPCSTILRRSAGSSPCCCGRSFRTRRSKYAHSSVWTLCPTTAAWRHGAA